MNNNMRTEVPCSKVELIVYLVVSPKSGRGWRIYTDEDVHALGGIHGIERALESETYWYVRLGQIQAEEGPHGWLTYNNSGLAELPEPPDSAWKNGRRNPAFRGSELELHVFKATFQAVERMLDSWKQDEDGVVEAYALKELKVSSDRLSLLVSGLHILPKVYEMVEITVIKYWYDSSWPDPHLPDDDDMVLAEYSLKVPLQIGWSFEEGLFRVEVMQMASC